MKRLVSALGITSFAAALFLYAQERPVFRVKVDMVVLGFTVTDSKGKYMTGLKPKDFRVLEDGIVQKLSTFAEGSKPPVQVMEDGSTQPLVAKESRGRRIAPVRCLCRNQRIRAVRYQQLYVPGLCLCLGRHRRLRSGTRPRRFGRGLYL